MIINSVPAKQYFLKNIEKWNFEVNLKMTHKNSMQIMMKGN